MTCLPRLWVLLVSGTLSAVAGPAPGQPSPSGLGCRPCHDRAWADRPDNPAPAGARSSLLLDWPALTGSAHAALACRSCHPHAQPLPHPPDLPPVTCTQDCHRLAAADYRRSIHALARAACDPQAPGCPDCHPSHRPTPAGSTGRTDRLNLHCLRCHNRLTMPADRACDGLHRRSALPSALPACIDCHGHHAIAATDQTDWPFQPPHVARVCSPCHADIVTVYRQSIHGRALALDRPDAPTCLHCHPVHQPPAPKTDPRSAALTECGRCHDQPARPGGPSLYRVYLDSAHGRPGPHPPRRAATCTDCHGIHDIDTIGPTRRPAAAGHLRPAWSACTRCHTDRELAGVSFDHFQPLGRLNRSADGSPLHHRLVLLAWLVLLGLTAAHWRCWRWRLAGSGLAGAGCGNGPPPSPDSPGCRAGDPDRGGRTGLIIILLVGLSLTGALLAGRDRFWPALVAGIMGGQKVVLLVHVMLGLLLLGVLSAGVVRHCRRGRGQVVRATLVGQWAIWPRWSDLRQFGKALKWLSLGGPMPRLTGRPYWQKWSLTLAGLVLIPVVVSGLCCGACRLLGPAAEVPDWLQSCHDSQVILPTLVVTTILCMKIPLPGR